MKRFDALSIITHQWLSFTPLFARGRAAASLFWPGCAALRLGAEAMTGLYRLLTDQKDMGFSTFCCGRPSLRVGSERSRRANMAKLSEHLSQTGVKRIFTLCPNCRKTLEPLFQGQVSSAWPLIERALTARSAAPDLFPALYALHDPCGARQDESAQNAVREILKKLNIRFEEMTAHGPKTRCCGRADMLFVKDPAKSSRLLAQRLEEARGREIMTYCESCVEAFKGGGHQAWHLVEAICGRRFKRSWLRRLAAVRALEGAVHA